MSAERSGNLAQCVADFLVDGMGPSETTRDHAKMVIADTFSANVAGACSEVWPVLAAYTKAGNAQGGHVILGTRFRASAEMAALANATMTSALEYDDVLSLMPGHPSAVVMAALQADQAALEATGDEIITAYAMGIEAGARIAQAMTLDHYKRGFQVTGTIAIFSAIAALARVRRYSKLLTRRAMGIGASFASGIQGNFGTMTKPLHSGWAARNALVAADMAMAGMTANDSVFEAEGGFFDAYGSAASSAALVEGRVANPWVFDDPGVTLKLFPCCYASHRGMDAVQKLMRDLAVGPADVDRIVAQAPVGGLIPLKFPRPRNRFESLFSLPYALAVTVLDGHPGLKSFAQERVEAADVEAMLNRIDVFESPAVVADYPEFEQQSYGSRAEVRVRLRTNDGREAEEAVRFAPGHPKRRMTWAQARAKFEGCAEAAGLVRSDAKGLFDRVLHLEEEKRFSDLIEQLIPPLE